MILVFDIGNTNIVFGVMKDGKVLHEFRFRSDPLKTADEYGGAILSVLEYHKIDLKTLDGVIISSVVPFLTGTISQMVKKYCDKEPVIINAKSDHGLNIQIDAPETLGADLLVSAVAAYHMYHSDCIVVDYGTATTIAAQTAAGDFLGGVIFPGVKLSAQALHSNTAQLPQVEIVPPVHVIGTNTEESIRSGLYYGYVDLVDGLIERMKKERFQDKKVKVLATGGLGRTLSAGSKHEIIYEPDLILYGLYFLYERLKNKQK